MNNMDTDLDSPLVREFVLAQFRRARTTLLTETDRETQVITADCVMSRIVWNNQSNFIVEHVVIQPRSVIPMHSNDCDTRIVFVAGQLTRQVRSNSNSYGSITETDTWATAINPTDAGRVSTRTPAGHWWDLTTGPAGAEFYLTQYWPPYVTNPSVNLSYIHRWTTGDTIGPQHDQIVKNHYVSLAINRALPMPNTFVPTTPSTSQQKPVNYSPHNEYVTGSLAPYYVYYGRENNTGIKPTREIFIL